MTELRIGDIVARRSYGCDVFFKVVDIREENGQRVVTLKGISYRIEADALENDLELQPEQKVTEYRKKCLQVAENRQQPRREGYGLRYGGFQKKAYVRDTPKEDAGRMKRPGKILHLDGDEDYLDTCLNEYRKLGVNITGQYVPERDQPGRIGQLLAEHCPDILVLTGHDGLLKGNENYSDVSAYRNSRHFVNAVKEARKFNSDLDSLVIFAGACQSLYSEIMKAGANYASSPKRALIHALDPVRVCQRIAFTGIDKIVQPEDVIGNTITGSEGIGGVQTRGKYREGKPQDYYGHGFI